MLILIKDTLVNLSNIKLLEISSTGVISADDELLCTDKEEAAALHEALKGFSVKAILEAKVKQDERETAEKEFANSLQEELNRRQAAENPLLMMKPPVTKN